MPTYEYRCIAGHTTSLVLHSDRREDPVNTPCPICAEALRRIWSPFRVATPFDPHFNLSTGQYVNTKRELDEQNRIASAERTQRLGLDTNFVAHDVRDLDAASMGVTEEGMNTTHDAQVAAGVKESKGKFVWGGT